MTADVWTERVAPAGPEPVLRCLDGPAAGGAAVTRHSTAPGTAWYVSTWLDAQGLNLVLHEAAMTARPEVPDGVEVVRRVGDAASYLLVINHSDRDVELAASGKELLTCCARRADRASGTDGRTM